MKKILVIEDDQPIRSAILKFLQAESYDAICAPDGYAGIQLALEQAPDLILCDIMMPECDGYEVLTTLRQNPATASLPFIFLSAKADRSDLRQGMDLGADDYLTKPFTRDELLGAIAARLSKQAGMIQPFLHEMRSAAEHLTHIAYRDPLTNLPNRILFYQRLQEALERCRRSHSLLGVLYLNLDAFKAINLDLGYASGDELLQVVAQRLSTLLGYEHTLARFGDDEFVVILNGVTQRRDAATMARSLLNALREPIALAGQYLSVQASLGIALYPDNGNDANDLIHHAKLAMRQAKQKGGSYQFYSLEIDSLLAQQEWISGHLRFALARNELTLVYQPQVNLITDRVIGFEAFLRWQHPEMGLLYPDKFLPMAEESGLIVEIGAWVLQTACAQAQTWQSPSHPPVKLVVNLSTRQFHQANLRDLIGQALAQSGLDPSLLVFDLTEATIMEDWDASLEILQGLNAMGVSVTIDDFGTGLSSLNSLKRLPIDGVKLDRSFVQDITQNAHSLAIAKAIVAVAQSLRLKAIAEGVETDEQAAVLRRIGCFAAQGNYFSAAIAPARLQDWLLPSSNLPGASGR